MRVKWVFCYFMFFLSIACVDKKDVASISFQVDRNKACDISEVFTDRQIVFLETIKESLLEEISKIICFEDRLYILDDVANSVVVFDTTGKFVSAIRPAGRGPQEYYGLSDFTINRKSKELIIHAHRPGKLLFYDLNCHFKREIAYRSLISAMAYDKDRLVLVNHTEEREPYFTFLSFDEEGGISEKRTSSFAEHIHSNQYAVGSLLLNSETLTFARRFDNALYSLEGNKVILRYLLDFKDHNVPERLYAPREEEEEKRAELQKGGYFFSIVNIKETPSFIFMKTNWIGTLRITKDPLKGDYWGHFTDQELGINHYGTICVEDESNRMVCFEHRILYMKLGIKDQWEKLPAWFADKIKNADDESNPVLIFYKSKE